jgi:SPOR domain
VDRHGFDLGDYSAGLTQAGHNQPGMAQRHHAPLPGHAFPQAHAEPGFALDPYAQPSQPRYAPPNEPQFAPAGHYAGEPVPAGLPRTGAPQQGQPYAAPPRGPAGQALPAPVAHAGSAVPDTDEEYDDEEFEDEPKRGGRKLLVVGALIGAICVGGGLAYTYKAFSGGKGALPTASAPAAKKPATPPDGGVKIAAKLPDAVPQQSVAAVTQDADGGARRVQTITVGPPGAAASPPPGVALPPPAPAQFGIPGMAVDMPAARPPAVAALPVQPPIANAPRPAAGAPAAGPQAQAPQPKSAAVAPDAAARKPAPVPVPKKAADAYTAPAAGGAPPAPGSGTIVASAAPQAAAKSALGATAATTGSNNGYVATVLSTPKGRPEAMKAFADLQQKYPDVLGAKPAEVQEKNLGAEKGIWYRAVVGPPGSREAASSVCTQLKASGYAQCFVSAY